MAAATMKREQQGEGKKAAASLIQEFEHEYTQAHLDALKSMETTRQDAWQAMYAEETKTQRDTARGIGDVLAGIAKRFVENFATEDDEKELGEQKKLAAEARIRRMTFFANTVQPIREPVDQCRKIIGNYRGKAAREEERAPLVFKGLQDALEESIKSMPGVKWDDKAGRVLVHNDPK